MRLYEICLRTRRGQWGQLAPTLRLCGRCPNHQPEQRGCFFLHFCFVFIGEKDKEWKISGLKPMTKLDLGAQKFLWSWMTLAKVTDDKTRFGGTIGFFLSWMTLAKVSWAPLSMKIVPAPLGSGNASPIHWSQIKYPTNWPPTLHTPGGWL